MFKNQKPFRRVGVGSQYICFQDTEVPGTDLSFEDDVYRLKTIASVETTEERTANPVYGSNEEYDTDIISEPPRIAVDNLAFPPAILARMRGNKVEDGFVVHSTFDEGEMFAYGVVFPKKGGKYQFVWYPKCKMVSISDSAQTKDAGGPNTQNRKVEIQASTFNDDGDFKVEYDYELLGSDDTPKTEEQFFAKPLLAPITAATPPTEED